MKRLLLFVGLLSAVIGISFHATTANAAINTWQKGISIQSRSSTDFGSSSFRQSVDNAAKDGVNYVTLVVSVHQDNINSNSVYSDGSTPTDSAIQSAASYLSSKGMGVAIAIHDDPYDGQWRAYVNASNPTAWFASYQSMLDHYASLAQSSGVNELIIGTEMSTMTQSKYTSNWIAMIKSVRSLYSGSLTYSAQHEGYMSDAQSLGFWSYLDKIGISAYYSLNGATTEPAMESAWKNWDQQEISVLSAKYGKPIIFTEVGFVSKDGSTQDPGSGYSLNTSINTTLQATAYDALFDYWQNSSEVQGMFLWDWSSDPNAGGSNDGNYTPQNKPAEAIMKKWYTTGASTGTGTTTPTSPATYTVKNAAAATAVTGASTSSTITVSASTAVTDAIVDVEVYDPNGQRVNQTYVEHQSLSSNGSSYVVTWTPAVVGTYTIKVGVFTANWQSQLFWTNSAGTVSVTAPVTTPPVTTPTPPVTTPTPPVTTPTPPVTTPTPPVTTPTPPVTLPTAISIWWPSNGSAVGGVQPFKAVINGRDGSTYDMFWQVDGGQLNAMTDNSNGGAHKESSVDLSSWNWNASKQYVITFVAKDKSGNVLSQQSVTITVN